MEISLLQVEKSTNLIILIIITILLMQEVVTKLSNTFDVLSLKSKIKSVRPFTWIHPHITNYNFTSMRKGF